MTLAHHLDLQTSKGSVGEASFSAGIQGYLKLWKGEAKSHTLPFPCAKLEIVWTAIDFGLEKGRNHNLQFDTCQRVKLQRLLRLWIPTCQALKKWISSSKKLLYVASFCWV